MKYPLKRIEISKGIFFNSIIDNKFKTNRISINIISLLDKKTVSSNAIIPFILRKGYKDIPDFTKFNEKLDEMYGTILDGDVRKIGNYQILNLYISSIDNKYTLENEDMVKDMTYIIGNVFLNPVLENGLFLKNNVEIEKNLLIEMIESEINDKRTYASNRLESIMFEESPYGINKYGIIDNIKDLNNEKVTDQYYDILKKSRIEIVFIGSGDSQKSLDIFKDIFSKINRDDTFDISINPKEVLEREKEVIDKLNVRQSKMVLGFTTGISIYDVDEIDALRLGIVLYGGMPFSKLFLNVREAMSLCYYCSSRLDKLNGCVIVESGVEQENIEKAKLEIINQLDSMKKGEFTDEELTHAKLALINSFKSVNDSPSMLEVWYIGQIFTNTQNTPKDDCDRINNITKKQVIDAISKVKLDTVYILTNNQ